MGFQCTYNQQYTKSSNIGGYRYFFNGQEADNEVFGEVANFGYEFRQYDSRLARWWSVDPKWSEYPGVSPFVFCNGSPIMLVDLEGKDVIPTSALKANQSVNTFFSKVEKNHVFRNVLKRFYSNQSNIYIHLGELIEHGETVGKHKVAQTQSAQNPKNPVGKYGIERIVINSAILDKEGAISGDLTFVFGVLLHEAFHARMFDIRQDDPTFNNYPGYKDFLSRPQDGWHHNQMGSYNRRDLVKGMKEFDSQMGTTHSDEWYEAVSWGGMRETTSWKRFEKNNPEQAQRYMEIIKNEMDKLGK